MCHCNGLSLEIAVAPESGWNKQLLHCSLNVQMHNVMWIYWKSKGATKQMFILFPGYITISIVCVCVRVFGCFGFVHCVWYFVIGAIAVCQVLSSKNTPLTLNLNKIKHWAANASFLMRIHHGIDWNSLITTSIRIKLQTNF